MIPPDPAPAAASASAPSPVPGLVRDRWLFRPSSWFEVLDLQTAFGRHAPLEVELGSGDGSFLVTWAACHPEQDFLGVERLLGRIRKLDRKAQRLGLSNLRGLRIEAAYCLEYLLPAERVTALHVYFPDPWPKRRHHKNRLVNARFTELSARVLVPAGIVHLRTDNPDYFAQMTAVFGDSPVFQRVATPPDLAAVTTDFEREFQARGVPTLAASYRRT